MDGWMDGWMGWWRDVKTETMSADAIGISVVMTAVYDMAFISS